MSRFSLDSMYQALETSPIGTQFQGPEGRQWVKTEFGLRKVCYPETREEVLRQASDWSPVPGGRRVVTG